MSYQEKFQTENYKTVMSTEVSELVKMELTVELKNQVSEELIEAYIERSGKIPDSYELTRLATWIVEDKENNPDKVSDTEYPILSYAQEKLRKRRETAIPFIENVSNGTKHKTNGTRKPTSFSAFGEEE